MLLMRFAQVLLASPKREARKCSRRENAPCKRIVYGD
jgi:hypothetical protein